MLQARSSNLAVQNNKQSMLYASEIVSMLDTHHHVDRSMGDIHAYGNPHVQFAANDMIRISRVVSKRLESIDPANAFGYLVNGVKFREHWRKKLVEWEQRAEPLRGKQVVSYHERRWVPQLFEAVPYFSEAFSNCYKSVSYISKSVFSCV